MRIVFIRIVFILMGEILVISEREKRWSVVQRLEFIEFRVFWENGINRSDIVDFFDVSVPQASNDLKLYREYAPENLRYDNGVKRYFANDSFEPKFIKLDAGRYLSHLNSLERNAIDAEDTWIASLPSFAAVALPRRIIDRDSFKNILTAIRQKLSIEIRYQSFTKPDATMRTITPHAFCFDGMRWHARAYCHKRESFRDFVLSRILETAQMQDSSIDSSKDTFWKTEIEILLEPHPNCSDGQRKAVELDYDMMSGAVGARMRHSMLFYFLKRQGFLGSKGAVSCGREKGAREQNVVLKEPDGVRNYLNELNA